MKILDCTLRDGGYYNQWDFDKTIVDDYITATNGLPIDYIEVGYRSTLQSEYFGKYFYLPLYELTDLREKSTKKISLMINEKDIRLDHLQQVLEPVIGLIDMVRMAVKPTNLERALNLAREIKKMGFEVCINLMYVSEWKDNAEFIESLKTVNGVVDGLYIVDSYGGSFPKEIGDLVRYLKTTLTCKLGFHGHNNLETALANTLAAITEGADFVDGTILGMGRGAGNLKTELLLTVLNRNNKLAVDFNALEKAIDSIKPLWNEYKWGTNLPYMISGANSLPQGEVIERTTVRYHTLNDIVHSLNNEAPPAHSNFAHIDFPKHDKILIVGGGQSIKHHKDGIISWLNTDPEIAIIHASSKNADCFKDLPHKQYFCLVGNEGRRLKRTLQDLNDFEGVCILPPYPLTQDAYVPPEVIEKAYELKDIDFTEQYHDAHTAIAIQTALNCHPDKILFAGYDGYRTDDFGPKERKLVKENEHLFYELGQRIANIMSLTPTNYSIPASNNLFYRLSYTPKGSIKP